MSNSFTIMVGIAGIVGAIFAVLQYIAPLQQPVSPSPTQERPHNIPAPHIPPGIDFTPDPTTAAVTKVLLPSWGYGQGLVTYSITNLGWADNMREVDYSLWAVVQGRLVKLDQRRAAFIAKGQHVAAENLSSPFRIGKMVVCVSYEFKSRRVNVIDFYTNEGTSSFQRQIGEMVKFRESLTQLDGADLCKAMPATAAKVI